MKDLEPQCASLVRDEPLRFMRRKAVEQRTGLSRSSIYMQIQLGFFPKPVALTDSGKTVAWLSLEIEAWMLERIKARDRKAG